MRGLGGGLGGLLLCVKRELRLFVWGQGQLTIYLALSLSSCVAADAVFLQVAS